MPGALIDLSLKKNSPMTRFFKWLGNNLDLHEYMRPSARIGYFYIIIVANIQGKVHHKTKLQSLSAHHADGKPSCAVLEQVPKLI